jgi:hypothetical protein
MSVVIVGLTSAGVVAGALAAAAVPAAAASATRYYQCVDEADVNAIESIESRLAGTCRVNTTTGAVTFTPADGFLGMTSMGYRLRATDGSVFSSFVTAVVRR